jgi:DNA mismatch repair protein MLH1
LLNTSQYMYRRTGWSKVCLFFCGTTPQISTSFPVFSCGWDPRSEIHPDFFHISSLRYDDVQVNWTSETDCFDSFLRELAYFYIPGPLVPAPKMSSSLLKDGEKAERWQIQHVLFPTMRRYLMAPKSLLDRDVVQVASLPDLYRVFERC